MTAILATIWRIELATENSTEYFHVFTHVGFHFVYTVEPGYNDVGLYDTSSVALDTRWYQLIPHC
jgi:hypothetical protein